MRLVIAEKPSVGRTIARHLGCREDHGGWIAGDGWAVTWCLGHIVELVPPDGYEGRGWGRPWRAEALPMVPGRDDWAWEVPDSVRDQYETISELLASGHVTEVVHACDPDREGEGICRRVLRQAGWQGPVLRLWTSSLEDSALTRAFSELRPDSDYDGLGDAALGRALADWLVGMNVTRAVACTYRRRGTSGRVMTPTLGLVVDRTRANRDYKSVPYWQLVARTPFGMELRGERQDEQEAARGQLSRAEGHDLVVTSCERRHERKGAPALYDLTTLQRDASRRYGITAQRTLDALQALYEARLATYPRTDSRYVTTDDADAVTALIAGGTVHAALGMGPTEGHDVGRVVRDDAVEGHTAVLPTGRLDAGAMSRLSGDQERVARLVCARLLVATSPAWERDACKLVCDLGGTTVEGTARATTEGGWHALEATCLGGKAEAEATVPADVREGSTITPSSVEVREGKTKPPALFTDDTLVAAMEHADRKVADEDLSRALRDSSTHAGGLGTPATRGDTIEKLVRCGYVERRGKSIVSTPEGELVDSLEPASLRRPEATARLEQQLSRVADGTSTLADFMGEVERWVADSVREVCEDPDPDKVAKAGKASPGPCPRCGRPMVASSSGATYYCSSTRYGRAADGSVVLEEEGCGFRFPAEVCHKRLTTTQVKALLKPGKVHVGGLRNRGGRRFEADVTLDPSETGARALRLEFGHGRATRGRKGQRR